MDPVIVNKDLTVIGGHQRISVLKILGVTEIECVSLSAIKVNKNQPKSKIYPIQRGKIPYVETAMTEGRKAIKSLLIYKTFSDLQYK